MTSEKLKSLFTGYRALLNATWTDETQARQLSESLTRLYSSSLAWTTKVAHYKFMCDEAVRFVDEGKIDKAMRWLGFLQGILWKNDLCTLDELKNHSRPDGGAVAIPDRRKKG